MNEDKILITEKLNLYDKTNTITVEDVIVRTETLTVEEIINRFGHLLTEEQKLKLYKFYE